MTNRWVRKRLPTGVAMFAVVLVSTMLFSSGGARASHGTFHEFSPPPGGVYIHWPANPTFMQVTMVDRTQPWPVTTATSNWDKPNAFIDNGIVHYHWWNCTHAVNCAIVYEINDPGAFYLGAAFRDWNLSNGHIKENTFIRVNNYYVPSGCGGETAADCRRHTICQEIGHTLGLNHQTGPSCMDDTDISELTPEYKNSGHDDHDQLHTAYDHGYH